MSEEGDGGKEEKKAFLVIQCEQGTCIYTSCLYV